MDIEFFQPFFTWLSQHPIVAALAVFVIALTESLLIVGLVVPGTVLMFGIGALIGAGVLDFTEAVIWAFAGAVAGDGISFWLGHHYRHSLHNIWPFRKHPTLLSKGHDFFLRHGGKSILFGRFVGPVRPIIPAVAGMMGMKLSYFFTVNILSAIVWAPAYLLPGMVFGASFELAAEVGLRLAILILLVICLGLLGYWFSKKIFIFLRGYTINHKFLNLPALLITIALFSSVIIAFTDLLQSSSSSQTPYATNYFHQPTMPINLHWEGSLTDISSVLFTQGWQRQSALSVEQLLNFLKTKPTPAELPALPYFFANTSTDIIFTKINEATQQRWVLRLWKQTSAPHHSHYFGNINQQSVYSFFKLITLSQYNHTVNITHLIDFTRPHPHSWQLKQTMGSKRSSDIIWDGKIYTIYRTNHPFTS